MDFVQLLQSNGFSPKSLAQWVQTNQSGPMNLTQSISPIWVQANGSGPMNPAQDDESGPMARQYLDGETYHNVS